MKDDMFTVTVNGRTVVALKDWKVLLIVGAVALAAWLAKRFM